MGTQQNPRVVVIGAGFGGLWAIRALAKAGAPAEITLVDRNNYHTFLALLYQVAAAEQSPEDIAFPARGILRKMTRAKFVMASARRVDWARRVVETDCCTIPFDYLVLAPGSRTNFYGVPGVAEHAFQLKSMDQGVELRNHILSNFEWASHEPDRDQRREMCTVAMVGGGAMGVEFAGALAELVHGAFRKDYPDLDIREVRLLMLEASEHLLSDFPSRLQDYCVQRLQRMGVEVRLKALVDQVGPTSVHLKSGETIPTRTVVWTAGVQGEALAEGAGLTVGRQGRVPVLPTLQAPEHPEAYVVGDLAYVEGPTGPLAMVAPVAIQEGTVAGQNIARQIRGEDPLPFRYRDKGRMATIGRNAAVAEIAGREFTGFIAWLLWLVIHLYNLIGFRNRMIVLINWMWDYLLMERAIRLILPSHHEVDHKGAPSSGLARGHQPPPA